MPRVRSRPKFPRRRSPRRILAVLLGLALMVVAVTLVSRCVVRSGSGENVPGAPPEERRPSSVAAPSGEEALPSAKPDGMVINLAGITAKKPASPPAPSSPPSASSTFSSGTPVQGNRELRAARPEETRAGHMDPTLPRTLSPEGQPPLFAAESNMWGQPFVGYGLDEISTILTERYKGVPPGEWGENIRGAVSSLGGKGEPSRPVVALTLDACGGKKGESFDEGIIDFLRQNNIPATIFISSKWIAANRQAFMDLSKDPLFEIAAHGVAHKPLSSTGRSAFGIKGTASIEEIVAEVEANAREIQRTTNKRPKWFRSGTAYYDEVAVKIIHDLGLGVAGFSIAADEGAALPGPEVEKKILSAKHGDIIVCHINHPQSGTRDGLLAALPRLLDKGYVFLTLSEATGQR